MLYCIIVNSFKEEGTHNIVKKVETKLGKFEMQLLAYAQLGKKESFPRRPWRP